MPPPMPSATAFPPRPKASPLAYIGKDTRAATALTLTAKPDGGDGDVVQDVAVGVSDAVLSVNGVGVKRDVRHDAEFRKGCFHGAHGFFTGQA